MKTPSASAARMERSAVVILTVLLLPAAVPFAPAAGGAMPRAAEAVGAWHATCGPTGCAAAELRGEGACHDGLVVSGAPKPPPPCWIRYELRVWADAGVGCSRAEIVGVHPVWPYESGGAWCGPAAGVLVGAYFHPFTSLPAQPLTVLTSARLCVPDPLQGERCGTFAHALPLAPAEGCGPHCAPGANDLARFAFGLEEQARAPHDDAPAACDASGCAWLRARHEVLACDGGTDTGFPCAVRWWLDVARAGAGPGCLDANVTGVPGWHRFCASGAGPEGATLGPFDGVVAAPLSASVPAEEMPRAELWATVCVEGACTASVVDVLAPR